jgi:hypothetical protein
MLPKTHSKVVVDHRNDCLVPSLSLKLPESDEFPVLIGLLEFLVQVGEVWLIANTFVIYTAIVSDTWGGECRCGVIPDMNTVGATKTSPVGTCRRRDFMSFPRSFRLLFKYYTMGQEKIS